MTEWQIPPRESLLPVSPDQSCAVCGREDWSWFYFLLSRPEWVRTVGWFPNWFVVMCSTCHHNWETGQRAALEAAWHEEHGDQTPDLEAYIAVVTAMQSEPPVERSAVSSL